MNPIWRQMKKRTPSSGQNGQLVHWWLLVHSAPHPELVHWWLLVHSSRLLRLSSPLIILRILFVR
jgi:hypothetical protein